MLELEGKNWWLEKFKKLIELQYQFILNKKNLLIEIEFKLKLNALKNTLFLYQ